MRLILLYSDGDSLNKDAIVSSFYFILIFNLYYANYLYAMIHTSDVQTVPA